MADDNKSHMFQPGQSGNSKGRPKDVINRPNLLKRSRELGIHVEDILLYFAAGNTKELNLEEGDITPNMQLKAVIESLKKMVPDLKSVDHNVSSTEDNESDTPVRTVVILPSNTRELPEDIQAEEVAMDDISAGVKASVDAELVDNDTAV